MLLCILPLRRQRKIHNEAMASMAAKESRGDEPFDEMDDLLDEDMEEAAHLAKGKSKGRRQGPGFDDGGNSKPVAAAKKTTAPTNTNRRQKGKTKPQEPVAVGGPAPAAAAEEVQQQKQTKSARGGSQSSFANLDNEMQLVARSHISTEGSSIKALENLDAEFFLSSPELGRHPHSAKLRGAPRSNAVN